MTACSAHAPMPAGRLVVVSVNGVAIARDAIVREMQHHPAAKPIAFGKVSPNACTGRYCWGFN